jgi:hypothetical protein
VVFSVKAAHQHPLWCFILQGIWRYSVPALRIIAGLCKGKPDRLRYSYCYGLIRIKSGKTKRADRYDKRKNGYRGRGQSGVEASKNTDPTVAASAQADNHLPIVSPKPLKKPSAKLIIRKGTAAALMKHFGGCL